MELSLVEHQDKKKSLIPGLSMTDVARENFFGAQFRVCIGAEPAKLSEGHMYHHDLVARVVKAIAETLNQGPHMRVPESAKRIRIYPYTYPMEAFNQGLAHRIKDSTEQKTALEKSLAMLGMPFRHYTHFFDFQILENFQTLNNSGPVEQLLTADGVDESDQYHSMNFTNRELRIFLEGFRAKGNFYHDVLHCIPERIRTRIGELPENEQEKAAYGACKYGLYQLWWIMYNGFLKDQDRDTGVWIKVGYEREWRYDKIFRTILKGKNYPELSGLRERFMQEESWRYGQRSSPPEKRFGTIYFTKDFGNNEKLTIQNHVRRILVKLGIIR